MPVLQQTVRKAKGVTYSGCPLARGLAFSKWSAQVKILCFFMCVSYKTLRNAPKMTDFALKDLDSPGLVGKNLFQSP